MNKKKHFTIDFIFPLALFLVFTACAILVTLFAATSYGKTTSQARDNYSSRTTLSYLREKVRHSDMTDSIGIKSYQGIDCLALTQHFDGKEYITYIYEYDGSLKELFIMDGSDIPLETGTDIMEINDFSITEDSEGLFRFSITDIDDHQSSILITAKSDKIEKGGTSHE